MSAKEGSVFSQKPSIVDDFMYGTNVANSDVYIRLGFLKKVFGILTCQLVISAIMCMLFMSSETVQGFVRGNSWMMIVSFVASMVLLFALHFKRKEVPMNYILLAVFTVCQSYAVATVVTFYTVRSVIFALGLTAAVTGSLTAYTLTSKRDFRSLYASLFSGLFILLIAGMAEFFFHSESFQMLLAGGGAILFSLFIIFDINMVMHHLSPEDYILASINLYLDIINLFLHILRIVGERK
ncbi:DgyrCDS4482 [Dimorphilus gyrociliatus]|uniref:DgyrCDS4482 n=1 Tax=Dimorphilus gyrociliatus TaxID=2664684 RepID=A0A7I8VGP3_9ANNE|nr:DgyrCDS4482 [Dimorphilus gyrociliatus]